MNKREIQLLICASMFGFLGGSLSAPLRPANASDLNVVRATRFEIVDNSGTPVAFWGPTDTKELVLAFRDQSKNQVAAFGIHSNGSPFLDLSGADGKSRVRVQLEENQKPQLAMSDEAWEGRLLLGFVASDVPIPTDGDWALRLRAPGGDFAGIGIIKNRTDGTLSGTVYVRGRGRHWSEP